MIANPNQDFTGTDRYELVSRIGRGDMGTVFKVYDREAQTHIALKALEVRDPAAVLRFKNEFRAMQDIQHPNLISLYELGSAQRRWFFTMELVEGGDFHEFVRAKPPLADGAPRFNEPRLRTALIQLARGLATLHAAHKVHRDIKPSNIRVTDDGRLVLLDSGLVLDYDKSFDLSDEQLVGTYGYVAPEQLYAGPRPQSPGPAVDCYAVGVLLYEALTGQLPHAGSMPDMLARKTDAIPRPPGERAPGVPADLDALCMDLLAIDPKARPTANGVLERLGQPPVQVPPSLAIPGSETFVGRTAELDALLECIDAPRVAQTVVIHGASGVGKSELLRRFAQLVPKREPDALVLSGRCYARESVPYKGVDGVIDALVRHLRKQDDDDIAPLLPDNVAQLADVFPPLRRVARVRTLGREWSVADPFEMRQKVFAALRELLDRLAHTRPLVILIDDMHWANADTWQLLDHVMQPPAPPLMLALTFRSSPTETLVIAPEHRIAGSVRVFRLEELDPDEARSLADELLRRSGYTDAVPAADLAAEAEGHPLFIQQLVRHLAEGGEAADLARLEDALHARVGRLSAGARRVLELVAAAAAPLEQQTIADAAELDLAEYSRLVTELRVAHMVRATGTRSSDTIECYHDRIREAALDGLDDKQHRALHRRLAGALEDSGFAERAPELAVSHLEAAGQRARAAFYAQSAAQRAMDVLAFDQAAALYRTALRCNDDDAVAGELQMSLADALANAGRGAEAADVFLEAARDAEPARRLDCQRRAAVQLLTCGHVERGTRVLADVLEAMGESLPARTRAGTGALAWQRLRVRLRGTKTVPRDETALIPRDLQRLDAYWAAAVGLSMLDDPRGAVFGARHLRLALDLGEISRVRRALALEAIYLAARGSPRRARRLVDQVTDDATVTEDFFSYGYALLARAALALFVDNDWTAARDATSEAEECFAQTQTGHWEIATARLYRCIALLYLGELGELSRSRRVYLRQAQNHGDRLSAVSLRTRFASPWLLGDDPLAGRQDVRDAIAMWPPERDGFTLPHWFAACSLAQFSLYEGVPDEAVEHLAQRADELDRGFVGGTPLLAAELAFLRGRIALAQAAVGGADRSAAIGAARRHARRLVRSSLPAPRAWGQLLEAAADIAADRPAATARLRSAIVALEQGDNHLYANAARYHLAHRIGGDEGGEIRVEVEAWMRAHPTYNVAAFANFLLPGCE